MDYLMTRIIMFGNSDDSGSFFMPVEVGSITHHSMMVVV
jgi:hypothetical protein